MANQEQKIIVEVHETGQRLDVFCVQRLAGYTRSSIQRAIKEGRIKVNGVVVKPRQTIRTGDAVSAELSVEKPPAEAPALEDVHIPILYEDKDVVVVDKPAGITVHPGVGTIGTTVAAWFANRFPIAQNVGEDPERPGIVHRLDKETSGVLVLAKTEIAYRFLKEQFQKRRAKKEYVALVFGVPGESKGRINRALKRSVRNPLRRTIDPAGKEAITEWRLEQKLGPRFALLRLYPFTGRTHQLRVHLHFLGYPIVGDTLYTFKRQRPPLGVTRHMLHAEKLTINVPSGERKTFVSPLPADFKTVVELLRNDTK